MRRRISSLALAALLALSGGALAACSDDARDEVEQDVEEGGRDVEQEAEENDGDNQGKEEDD